MGKKAALQHNIRALEIIEKYKEKYGLCLQVGFILFDYGTTMDEIRENYKMLKKYSWAVTRGFTEMYAAVGTPYTKLLKNKGLIEGEEAYLQNYSYSVMDPDALKVYNALKEWHVNYVKLYDMTIDPITKPKALGDNGFKKFHSFYMEIKEREMQYFGEILDMVGRYKSQEEIDEYVKTSIENSKEWIRKMQERVNELYKSEDIYYLAVANPFMCKDPKKQ
jgi:hypothetical protein